VVAWFVNNELQRWERKRQWPNGMSGRDLQTPREPSVRIFCPSRRRFQLVMATTRVWILCWYTNVIGLSKLAQTATLLTPVQKVPGSNLDRSLVLFSFSLFNFVFCWWNSSWFCSCGYTPVFHDRWHQNNLSRVWVTKDGVRIGNWIY
jgi:hypothetical protein